MANMASACALVIANDSKMFGTIHSWRAREAASTCILVTISAVCICIMVVCGVLLAREYSLAKGYERTSCTVRNVSYTGSDQSCVFCSGHKEKGKDRASSSCVTSYFPCIQVIVTYVIDWVEFDALVHHDSLQATGMHRECSFNICLKEREENERQVEAFAGHWRQLLGQTISCFYNTADSGDVIMHKTYSLSDVVHSMFWPSLVIVICGAVFLRLETRRRRLTFCGRREDLDDDAIESSPSRKSTPDAILDGLLETQVILRDDRLHQYGGVQCQLVHPRPSLSVDRRTSWGRQQPLHLHAHSSMVNVAAAAAAAAAAGSAGSGSGHLSVYDDMRRIEMKRRSLDASSCHHLHHLPLPPGLRFTANPSSPTPSAASVLPSPSVPATAVQQQQQQQQRTPYDHLTTKLRLASAAAAAATATADMSPRKSLPTTTTIRLTP